MSAANVEFSGAIRATAKALGHLASENVVKRLNQVAQSLGSLDAEAGTVVFANEDGSVTNVGDWISSEVGKLPRVAATATSQAFTGQTAVAAALAERIRRQNEADTLAHAEALARGPNPWSPEHWNQTKQNVIRRQLPHIAAQLKARAA